MAVSQPSVFNKSLLAAVDLSAKQFRFVADNGSGKYNIAGGVNGAVGAGFLNNLPLADEACEVMTVGGGAKGKAAGTIAVKDELIADANGELILSANAGSADDNISAIALEAAVSGDVFAIQPIFYIKDV